MKRFSALTLAAMASLLGSTVTSAANLTQINRYATVENKALAAQINPLLAVQKVHFPQNITTVHAALDHWLQYSSFQMAPIKEQSTALRETLLLPLPSVVRDLGPLTVEEGLLVLVGNNVFTLSKDLLHRKVNFALRPQFQPKRGIKA
jgi:type IV pili sensor histidine kinase/response regulator